MLPALSAGAPERVNVVQQNESSDANVQCVLMPTKEIRGLEATQASV